MDTEEMDAMKSQTGDHPESKKRNRELKALEDLDADAMVMISRRHYATNFPNPQRRGCPTPGEVLRVIEAGRTPDQHLLDHLFACSECFGEYRQTLVQHRDEIAGVPVAGWSRMSSIFTMKRISAMVILSSLVFVVCLMLREPAPGLRNSEPALSTASGVQTGAAGEKPPNQIAAPAPAVTTQLPAQRRGVSRTSQAPGASDLIVVKVDLDDYRVLREPQEGKSPVADEKPSGKESEKPPGGLNEKLAEEKMISLPAARAFLVLRLPETAVAGEYTVSLVDAFDLVLFSRQAVSREGVKLRVALDLRRIAPEKYRLRLSREGEAPAYYDVIIKKR